MHQQSSKHGSFASRAVTPHRPTIKTPNTKIRSTDVEKNDIHQRIRQRIEARVQQLQALKNDESNENSITTEDGNDEKNHVLERDVLRVAVEILGKCLSNDKLKQQRIDESLEVLLVHRMLAKENELFAMQHVKK